jgi:hypothetical protein
MSAQILMLLKPQMQPIQLELSLWDNLEQAVVLQKQE